MRNSLLFLLTFVSVSLYAQDKIDTERPSESLSPTTVSKKSFQAEIGFRKTKDNEQDKVWRNPNILMRYGLFNKLELRLETTVENQKLVSENEFRNGVRPVEVGAKFDFFETKNEAFSSAITAQVGIPSLASTDHQLDKAYHRLRLLFENKLTDKFKLHYNVGSDWDSEDQEQNWVYTFSPEFEIADKWETFVELYGFLKKGKTPEDVVDAGFAYLVSKKAKFDLSGGLGLNHDSPHYFVAAGFSLQVGGRK